MVVILKVMIQDGVVHMVGPQEVLECPRPLVCFGFDVLDIDGRDVDGSGRLTTNQPVDQGNV